MSNFMLVTFALFKSFFSCAQGFIMACSFRKAIRKNRFFYSEPLAICFFCRRNKFCLCNVYVESLNAAEADIMG